MHIWKFTLLLCYSFQNLPQGGVWSLNGVDQLTLSTFRIMIQNMLVSIAIDVNFNLKQSLTLKN